MAHRRDRFRDEDLLSSNKKRRTVRLLAKRRSTPNVRMLPVEFQPGPNDVLCGRGTTCFEYIGNQRFRQLVEQHVPRYIGLQKLGKTMLIDEIVQRVRRSSPNGGFIKKSKETGLWFEVGDQFAVSTCRCSSVGVNVLSSL